MAERLVILETRRLYYLAFNGKDRSPGDVWQSQGATAMNKETADLLLMNYMTSEDFKDRWLAVKVSRP